MFELHMAHKIISFTVNNYQWDLTIVYKLYLDIIQPKGRQCPQEAYGDNLVEN